MTRWVTIIAALLATSTAEAQCLGFQCPPGVLGARTSGAPLPLDGFSQPSGAYSFRLLRQAYLGTGAAFRIKRVSDSAEIDVGFAGSGAWDEATAVAHCGLVAGACNITIAYDQSGNGRDLPLGTTAPTLVLGGAPNGIAHMRMTSASFALVSSGTFTPATGVVSMSVVANRSAGVGPCGFLRENGAANRLQGLNAAPSWSLIGGGGGTVNAAAADAAWHAGIGVVNGAASVLGIDGTETTGTATGNTVAGVIQVSGIATTTCDEVEWVFWDNYVLTPAERATLVNNQRNYWLPAPLDTFATPSGAYSFRKLKSTYAGAALRIRRASDNLETDIGFLGFVPGLGSPWDEAAANAHCAATTCFLTAWYDQSGNARHLTQATPANQPAIVFGCQNSLPCTQETAGGVLVAGTALAPATGVASISAVGNRVTGIGFCGFLRQNAATGSRIAAQGVANNWNLLGGTSGTISAAANDNAWHSAQAVVNGASSSLTIDGTTTTGTTAGSTASGAPSATVGAATTTCRQTEAIWWDNYVLTAGEIAALTANQRSFWNF